MTTARRLEETIEQYRERQRFDKIHHKFFKRGRIIWDSKTQGTYIRKDNQK